MDMGLFNKSIEGTLIRGWIKIMNDSISKQLKGIDASLNSNDGNKDIFVRDAMDIIVKELDQVKFLIQTNFKRKYKLK